MTVYCDEQISSSPTNIFKNSKQSNSKLPLGYPWIHHTISSRPYFEAGLYQKLLLAAWVTQWSILKCSTEGNTATIINAGIMCHRITEAEWTLFILSDVPGKESHWRSLWFYTLSKNSTIISGSKIKITWTKWFKNLQLFLESRFVKIIWWT